MIDIDWNCVEDFTGSVARISDPVISILVNRTITLGCAFLSHAKKQMTGATHVLLSFEAKNNVIIFNFTNDKNKPGALKISLKHNNASIAAKSFFNNFGINALEKKGRYFAELLSHPQKGDVWAIFL